MRATQSVVRSGVGRVRTHVVLLTAVGQQLRWRGHRRCSCRGHGRDDARRHGRVLGPLRPRPSVRPREWTVRARRVLSNVRLGTALRAAVDGPDVRSRSERGPRDGVGASATAASTSAIDDSSGAGCEKSAGTLGRADHDVGPVVDGGCTAGSRARGAARVRAGARVGAATRARSLVHSQGLTISPPRDGFFFGGLGGAAVGAGAAGRGGGAA